MSKKLRLVVLGMMGRCPFGGQSWLYLNWLRGFAFYDRSRNNGRVWHDVHTCGNVANLRASRARRRAGAG